MEHSGDNYTNYTFGTVTKGLLKGLEDLEVGGRVETIQTTALLRTARILRRVLETWEDLLSLKFQRKTISYHRCEKLFWVNNNEIYIIIRTVGTVTKGLVQGLLDLERKGWVKTIQTTILLRSVRILRKVLEAWGDVQSPKSQRKTIR